MLRKKMLAIGALVALGLLAVVSPVAAAAAPKAGASSAPLADQAVVRAPDCANAKNHIADLLQRADKSGSGMVNCVRSSSSAAGSTGTSSAAAAAGLCFGAEILKRLSSCTDYSGRLIIFTKPDGVVVGTIDYVVKTEVFLSGRADRWRHNFTITSTSSWGLVKGVTVAGTGVCVIECVPVGGTLVGGSAEPPASHSGIATFDSEIHGSDDVWTAGSAWTFTFTCPFCTPLQSNPTTVAASRHRCDSTIGNRPAGCAYEDVIPTHEISRQRFPQYARHIELAINHKLPDLLEKGSQELAERNGRIACPPDDGALYMRPPGMSCDEYPFRSTKQGAANQPYGRTFFIFNFQTGQLAIDCKVKWLARRGITDSGGYNVCMIPEDQNREGGNDLQVFYYDNRVIEGDEFRVKIVN
ncbi:hypothetical protein GCM10022419_125490 [Nonomuraea rosea]|uniref:Uncharacterized protein n=1 Tax=Nonomuraea rosea TaxID=638574 RepID=A0ABP6ZU20_9ACTN